MATNNTYYSMQYFNLFTTITNDTTNNFWIDYQHLTNSTFNSGSFIWGSMSWVTDY